jgi:hypothetical protein
LKFVKILEVSALNEFDLLIGQQKPIQILENFTDSIENVIEW